MARNDRYPRMFPFRRLILGRRNICVRLDGGTAVETVYLII